MLACVNVCLLAFLSLPQFLVRDAQGRGSILLPTPGTEGLNWYGLVVGGWVLVCCLRAWLPCLPACLPAYRLLACLASLLHCCSPAFLPACLPACLPVRPLACLLVCLPACGLVACLPVCLPACLPACRPACLPARPRACRLAGPWSLGFLRCPGLGFLLLGLGSSLSPSIGPRSEDPCF